MLFSIALMSMLDARVKAPPVNDDSKDLDSGDGGILSLWNTLEHSQDAEGRKSVQNGQLRMWLQGTPSLAQ